MPGLLHQSRSAHKWCDFAIITACKRHTQELANTHGLPMHTVSAVVVPILKQQTTAVHYAVRCIARPLPNQCRLIVQSLLHTRRVVRSTPQALLKMSSASAKTLAGMAPVVVADGRFGIVMILDSHLSVVSFSLPIPYGTIIRPNEHPGTPYRHTTPHTTCPAC